MVNDAFSRRLEHLRRAMDRPNAPLDVFASLVDALLESGDRAGALDAFRRHAPTYDRRDAHAKGRLRALHERILWHLPLEVPGANLPTARFAIVGRDAETHAIVEQSRRARTLTLTGPGGVGKTRIALEVARRILPEFRDGATWVDLSSIDGESHFAEHIAHTMGLSLPQPGIDMLVESLSGATRLLILDRCELALDAARALAEGLRGTAPGVQLLMTSRISIGATDEAEVRIAPLTLPSEHAESRAEILRSPAVQLFVERAAVADARFTVTEQSAREIATLCRRIGGLPLAIELAASTVGHLPFEQIARRNGGDDLLETIAWSYDLLDESQQETLRRFSVFVAPFTFSEAAAAVSSDPAATLKRLVDASLVQMRLTSGSPKYYLLDSARDFLRAGLRDDECSDVQRSLIAYYAKLARGNRETQALLEPAIPNVAAVVEATLHDARCAQDTIAVMAAAAIRFGMLGYVDAAALCQTVVERVLPAVRETMEYADVLRSLGWFLNQRGRLSEALALGNEAFERAKAAGDVRRMVNARSNATISAINSGDYATARMYGDETLALARSARDAALLPTALRAAAATRVAIGEFRESVPLFEELLALEPEVVPQNILATALHDYSIAQLYLGNPEVARTLALKSLEISATIAFVGMEADARNLLGAIALATERIPEALAHYRAALALARRSGVHVATMSRSLEGCAASVLRDDQLDAAAAAFGHAEQIRVRFHAPLNPFEHDRWEALRLALTSRMGDSAYAAAVMSGRTKSFAEICAVIAPLEEGSAPPRRAERFASLTAREREIATSAAAGSTNREISEQLHLSVRTVENHLAAIYRKLGVKTRDEL